jgi:hypothetical protein
MFVHWSQHPRLERPFRRRLGLSIYRRHWMLQMQARLPNPLYRPLFQ